MEICEKIEAREVWNNAPGDEFDGPDLHYERHPVTGKVDLFDNMGIIFPT